ncbi:hypothetical protein [Mycolicibacterium sphagni]|uniref:Uncharacterized protein n=1 Tax=Mycolicibacterium sphagni TaxID=1786 RepID=A0A255DP37_9MYCO|nr:hypothetical protein [Mycolicibacterium sphagni]OYN80441.1 hypothetical protein CG716_09985 [Mycolicibacterium sphagni]
MSFQARYTGACAAERCRYYPDDLIREGDDVDYLDDELMHAECAKATRRGEPPMCPNCFTHHRGEC